MMEAIKNFICTGQPDHSVVNLSLGLHWYDEGYLFSFDPGEGSYYNGWIPLNYLSACREVQGIPDSHLYGRERTVTTAGSAWEVDDNGKQYLVKMEGEKMLVLDKARTGQWPLERCGEWDFRPDAYRDSLGLAQCSEGVRGRGRGGGRQ